MNTSPENFLTPQSFAENGYPYGAAIAVVLATLLDGDPREWRNYSIINCGVNELVLDSSEPALNSYNAMF